jgi:hypothetical protein
LRRNPYPKSYIKSSNQSKITILPHYRPNQREREREVPLWLAGVGLDRQEGDGVGSMDSDGVVVMSAWMLCVRVGRRKWEKERRERERERERDHQFFIF